ANPSRKDSSESSVNKSTRLCTCANTPPNNEVSLCTRFASTLKNCVPQYGSPLARSARIVTRKRIVACATSDDWSQTCAMRRCDCRRLFNCVIKRRKVPNDSSFRSPRNCCCSNAKVFLPHSPGGKGKRYHSWKM